MMISLAIVREPGVLYTRTIDAHKYEPWLFSLYE